MADTPSTRRPAPAARGKAGILKRSWRKVRTPLLRSPYTMSLVAGTLARYLRFVRFTNKMVAGTEELERAFRAYAPAIVALWHGQHLLSPCVSPRGHGVVAMVSRSSDAELNALVVERLGLVAVRGSGGRRAKRHVEKGGAKALLTLKRAVEEGKTVAMIADIPNGTPREAGLGIITLARLTGRPIVGLAVATSRRHVLEQTWDKTTINLPFGRCAATVTEPVYVPADADDGALEEKRRELTDKLNAATSEAYRLADGGK